MCQSSFRELPIILISLNMAHHLKCKFKLIFFFASYNSLDASSPPENMLLASNTYHIYYVVIHLYPLFLILIFRSILYGNT